MSWKKQQQIDLAWILLLLSSSFSFSFFPVGKLLIPDSDIMSNNLGGSFFADLHNTQHFYTSFLACQKSTGAKKNLNISIVEEPSAWCLEVLECKAATSKSFFSSDQSLMIGIIKVSISMENLLENKVKKNGPVCSYNPIRAEKVSFEWPLGSF